MRCASAKVLCAPLMHPKNFTLSNYQSKFGARCFSVNEKQFAAAFSAGPCQFDLFKSQKPSASCHPEQQCVLIADAQSLRVSLAWTWSRLILHLELAALEVLRHLWFFHFCFNFPGSMLDVVRSGVQQSFLHESWQTWSCDCFRIDDSQA